MEMNAATWNEIISNLPGRHILQTWEWGQVKEAHGWQAQHRVWSDAAGSPQAAALILTRSLPVPVLSRRLRMLYIPRGPLMDWSDTELRTRVLDDLQQMTKAAGAIFMKVDPEVMLGMGIPGTPDEMNDDVGEVLQSELVQRGWRYSEGQVQFRNTVWVDINHAEEDLLARMKPKTRYNIRLAERKGVTVRIAGQNELPLLYRMYAETSVRDGFVIRSQDYYEMVWRTFIDSEMAVPLIAEVDGQPVAGLILFTFGDMAWYLYGMSTGQHREKMPNHLLQWEAMRVASARGCTFYDLWGAPDVFDESDSMWGVYRFKEGLGGKVVRTVGAWDFPASPVRYALFMRGLPRILDWLRRRRKASVRQEVVS
jgi:peptidoglycan pentaglycine glycine transferase (the first glycine)